jgi:hypothetical protein
MWEDVAFTVMGTAAPGSGQSGFSMSPDEAKKALDGLLQVKSQLKTMHEDVARLCAMRPPSQDPVTLAMHKSRVGDGGGALGAFSYGGGHIDLQLSYVNELADRIAKALHITVAADEEQAGQMSKLNMQEDPK